jgi:hypothetical protein
LLGKGRLGLWGVVIKKEYQSKTLLITMAGKSFLRRGAKVERKKLNEPL